METARRALRALCLRGNRGGTWAGSDTDTKNRRLQPDQLNIRSLTAPTVNREAKGGASTPACPGKSPRPPRPGNLCVYTSTNDNPQCPSSILRWTAEPRAAGTLGCRAEPVHRATAPGVAYGTWAVTG